MQNELTILTTHGALVTITSEANSSPRPTRVYIEAHTPRELAEASAWAMSFVAGIDSSMHKIETIHDYEDTGIFALSITIDYTTPTPAPTR